MFTDSLTDQELMEVVRAMDRVALPLDRRFDGDDSPITELMTRMGMSQDVVTKLMITGAILRECVARGITIERGN